MLYPGLVSITFRQLDPAQIIALTAAAGLAGIEWGGDVHVPPGDVARAAAVRRQTEDAGLRVSAYGSYYRLTADEPHPFEEVLASAAAPGAPVIRVWAGRAPSAEADAAERDRIAAETRRIADLAAAEGIAIAYEFHANTLTDSGESARKLLEAVDHPNVYSFWQPINGAPVEVCAEALTAVTPWLHHIHIFHWWPTSQHRHPLILGEERWRSYLSQIAAVPGDRFVSIEFVAGDEPAQFEHDARTLHAWLGRVNGQVVE